MRPVLSPEEMRAVEAAAMTSGRVTGAELMLRAGAGVVAAVEGRWSALAAGGGRAVVLAGRGNNGGDGYVIARLLREKGWSVAIHALGEPATKDAAAMREDWGAPVLELEALDGAALDGAELVVDALFGTGLTRPLAPAVSGALRLAQEAGVRLVAVDILSGLSAETGQVLSEAPFVERPADLTVTFQAPKLGHVLTPGARLTGPLEVVDIGLGAWLGEALEGWQVVQLTGPGGAQDKVQGHKYDHGHALVFAGGVGRGGAGRLAARSALRIGAGAVTLAPTPGALQENAAALDAVMLRAVAGVEAAEALLEDSRLNALCLGPGCGVARAAEILPVLARSGRALVLDADALTALAEEPARLGDAGPRSVLTPHPGEFARLFPDLGEALKAGRSKLEVTREAAARIGAVVLLKGPDTVIAAPDGRAAINDAGGQGAVPWLATAGAGDVLAGFVTGLLARGWPPFEAAAHATWLHTACARSFGPGLIAEDLAEELPKVLRRLASGESA
ncbi:NAD(P)H-hydrate dehydratase [Pseudoroseicyclus tamaricis]|uniref:Bifunctional NAD(P)H-hydrate repair enzyme n=1 Tax=Pseudoroseicyclus tamaricis TaxID=2705421 RepID=A0A6B2JXY9_9RHOB|nr:NAD(P)H-hydrate dehydratase [Pseudoroseicyclus tamaricis]NDV01144.1 NAD(P)H-hydrate dehydratase [Pseudoroseicyclus tamaricis]